MADDDPRRAARSIVFKMDVQKGKEVYRDSFKRLIQTGQNEDVRYHIQNLGINVADIADDTGMTLLHLAAKYNNMILLEFCLNSECLTEVGTETGETPLVCALKKGHFEAARFLVSWRDAHITAANIIVSIPALLKWKKHQQFVPFVHLLAASTEELDTMARAFIGAKVSLTFIINLFHSRLTHAVLRLPPFREMRKRVMVNAINCALRNGDIENLRVLWSHDDERMRCRMADMVWDEISLGEPPKWTNYIRHVLTRIGYWTSVVDEHLANLMKRIGVFLSSDAVTVLLVEYNLDRQMLEDHNYNILPYFFGNPRSKRYVTDLVMSRPDFGISVTTVEGETALHMAACEKLVRNVQLLLDMGADCNVRDEHDLTPIQHTYSDECAELLLRYGTDLHALDESGRAIPEYGDKRFKWQILYAQLAIDECRGIQFRNEIRDIINANERKRKFFQKCVYKLKITPFEPYPHVTLWRIITRRPEDIPECITTQEVVTRIMKSCNVTSVLYYYRKPLKIKLNRILKLYQSKRRAADIISSDTTIPITYAHLIIDEIFQYLTYEDMVAIISV